MKKGFFLVAFLVIPLICFCHGKEAFSAPDWEKMFYPSVSIFDIMIRGSLIYLGLFFLLRVVLKREAGSVGMTDLLVVVLLADASQNAMANNYISVTDGLLLVAVIIGWSHLLNFIGYHFPGFQRFISPPPLLLIKNGNLLYRNLRKELLTPGELMSQIREQGIEDIRDVEEAFMESNGKISVLGINKSCKKRNEAKS